MEKEKLIKSGRSLRKKIIGYIEWDMNDGDYSSKSVLINEVKFFSNETLLNVLAFVSTPPSFKGMSKREDAFGHYLIQDDCIDWSVWESAKEENKPLDKEYLETCSDPIAAYLCENDLVSSGEGDGYPHSVTDVKLYYIDEEEKIHPLDFEPIRNNWKNLSYKEILKLVNLKCLEFLMK